MRVVGSLMVVLGLVWLAAKLSSRRLGGGGSRALVRVRGRQSLSRTASLAVVEVGTRVLVVGVSDGGVRLLTELDPEELEVEETVDDPASSGATTSGRRRVMAPQGGLAGSLLSAQTWKQALAVATNRQRSDDDLLTGAPVLSGEAHD